MTRQSASITVIIATYNRAALLDECLAHLRAQAFRPGDEVIVVDNGSTDETSAVVARHQARVHGAPASAARKSSPGSPGRWLAP